MRWLTKSVAMSFWAVSIGVAAAAPDEEAERAARWTELQHSIFGERAVADGTALVQIDAPARALDAALVPVTLSLKSNRPLKGVYLIIDNNPGPLAGHFEFGPQADPRTLKLRVRVNAYTYLHAVAETIDGKLYATARFIKAAGGCSAPAGADPQQALADLGRIKLKLLDAFLPGKPLQAQVMIRHPNFNGMQMDQVTRMVTPAMFIRSIEVTYQGTRVLHLDSDISLSSDPVIGFGFVPKTPGQLQVTVKDTRDQTFGQSFDVPAPTS